MQRALQHKSLVCLDFGPMLRRAGFVDVQSHTRRLPLNPWLPDSRGLAHGYASILASDPSSDSPSVFEGMTMAPMTRNLGRSKAAVDQLIGDVLKDVHNPDYHVYHNL